MKQLRLPRKLKKRISKKLGVLTNTTIPISQSVKSLSGVLIGKDINDNEYGSFLEGKYK